MKFSDKKIYLIDKDNNKELIATRTFIAKNIFTRFRGLMLNKALNKNHALIIYPCNSIHMFFMRFPLDIIYLDERLNVLKIRENILPWQLDLGHKGAKYVIEVPGGTIDKKNTKAIKAIID